MKRLVVCADGTWNSPGAMQGGKPCPTNVVKLAQAVAPTAADGVVQIVYYHDGVGTHPGLDRVLGGMFGLGLDRNICDLYRFLVQNFEAGDEIYLFGFSRGAFTVRSLAGMIRKCGVLRKNRVDEVNSAYQFYRSDHMPGSAEAKAFRTEKAVETRIRCIGVWDTVGALGIPVTPLRFFSEKKYRFHDVQLSSWVDNAFHALAIDERRAPFRPAIWEAQQPTVGQPPQTVKQVWFAGVHSDIGGGYASAALSDVTLEWMIREAAGCGLGFLSDVLAGLAGDPLGEIHDSMTVGYRLLGDGTRHIQQPTGSTPTFPTGFQRLDPSVEVRYADAVLGYRPRPLADYYERAKLARASEERAREPVHADTSVPGAD
ncbi:MAG TPA: DUF2235 domain-containing protein [Longimicrobiales bacterium]